MPPVEAKSTPGCGQILQTQSETVSSREQEAETSVFNAQSTSTALGNEDAFSALQKQMLGLLEAMNSTCTRVESVLSKFEAADKKEKVGQAKTAAAIAGLGSTVRSLSRLQSPRGKLPREQEAGTSPSNAQSISTTPGSKDAALTSKHVLGLIEAMDSLFTNYELRFVARRQKTAKISAKIEAKMAGDLAGMSAKIRLSNLLSPRGKPASKGSTSSVSYFDRGPNSTLPGASPSKENLKRKERRQTKSGLILLGDQMDGSALDVSSRSVDWDQAGSTSAMDGSQSDDSARSADRDQAGSISARDGLKGAGVSLLLDAASKDRSADQSEDVEVDFRLEYQSKFGGWDHGRIVKEFFGDRIDPLRVSNEDCFNQFKEALRNSKSGNAPSNFAAEDPRAAYFRELSKLAKEQRSQAPLHLQSP
jgi:hypothetical protein